MPVRVRKGIRRKRIRKRHRHRRIPLADRRRHRRRTVRIIIQNRPHTPRIQQARHISRHHQIRQIHKHRLIRLRQHIPLDRHRHRLAHRPSRRKCQGPISRRIISRLHRRPVHRRPLHREIRPIRAPRHRETQIHRPAVPLRQAHITDRYRIVRGHLSRHHQPACHQAGQYPQDLI